MKSILFACGAVAALVGPVGAQDADLNDTPLVVEADSLDDFLWTARPVVVFADTPNDPRFVQQMQLLEERKAELLSRDVVVLTDTDPDARTDLRTSLRPRGFALVIVGKDGKVAQRKPAPWDVREITRAIDRMPLRRQEIRDAQRLGGEG
ncbi:MAG: DUF4174 domain-containing protein [Pseudomonadota bacterium]